MIDVKDGTKQTLSHWTQKTGKPILLVDFDHTITRKCLACNDRLVNDGLQEGCKKALIQLAKLFRIWIYTGTGKHLDYAKPLQRDKREIETFLRKNGIPFEKVLQTKPPACFIIDDRAIHHTSWKNTLSVIDERMKQKLTLKWKSKEITIARYREGIEILNSIIELIDEGKRKTGNVGRIKEALSTLNELS